MTRAPDSLTSHGGERYLPQRIVSLQPSATVTLAGLGLATRVVACTRWCVEVCPEMARTAIVADSWSAKAEQILAAKPDLVIASVPYQLDALAEIMKAGIPFLGLAPHGLRDVYHDIGAIARSVGEEEAGLEMIEGMKSEIEQVSHCAAHAEAKPRVYCEEWGKPMIHSQRWVAELVDAGGGEFIGKPGTQTTADGIREGDPDILVFAWCGAGDRVPLEKVVAQRGWQKMRAVAANEVYCVPDEFLNTPAVTLLQGLHALAGIIHPELFVSLPRVRRIGETRSAETTVPEKEFMGIRAQ